MFVYQRITKKTVPKVMVKCLFEIDEAILIHNIEPTPSTVLWEIYTLNHHQISIIASYITIFQNKYYHHIPVVSPLHTDFWINYYSTVINVESSAILGIVTPANKNL